MREAYRAGWEDGRAEVERLHSWDGLMELLDEHWPADIFPTLEDTTSRDPGPRIVSLLRWVERLRPRRVESVAELDALPVGTVVVVEGTRLFRLRFGDVWQEWGGYDYESVDVPLPALLWTPGEAR